jgi:hypothetical protein
VPVIISYSRQDVHFAKLVQVSLETEGYESWIDIDENGVRPGENWFEAVARRVWRSRCCIVLWSAHAVRSEPVLREAREALKKGILINAIVSKGVSIPDEFKHISGVLLDGWKGDRMNPQWRSLIDQGVALKERRTPIRPPTSLDMQKHMIASLESKGGEISRLAETAAREFILSCDAKNILTFELASGRRISPAPTIDYLKALACFLMNWKLDGVVPQTIVAGQLANVVNHQLAEFLRSETVKRSLIGPLENAVVTGEPASRKVWSALSDQTEWIGGSLAGALDLPGGDLIAADLTEPICDQAFTIMGETVAGTVAVGALGTAITLPVAKTVVVSATYAAITALLKGSAFKVILLGTLKKAAFLTTIKTVLGTGLSYLGAKLGLSKLSAGGLTAILGPLVIVGLLAGLALFINKEIKDLPKKLAQSAPPQIGQAVQKQWRDISQTVVGNVLRETAKKEARRYTKTTSRHVLWGVLIGAGVVGTIGLLVAVILALL